MPDILNNVSQEELDNIAQEFVEATGNYRGEQYLHFYAKIQEGLMNSLKAKFASIGYGLKREDNPKYPNRLSYRPVDKKKKPVGKSLLDFTYVTERLIYLNPDSHSPYPDVKLVRQDYLQAKIEEIVDGIFDSYHIVEAEDSGEDAIIKETDQL